MQKYASNRSLSGIFIAAALEIQENQRLLVLTIVTFQLKKETCACGEAHKSHELSK